MIKSTMYLTMNLALKKWVINSTEEIKDTSSLGEIKDIFIPEETK